MNNLYKENVQEHSQRVATIAHMLAVIKKSIYHEYINPERVALLALYHDANEVITGDLPTPIKYFTTEIKEAYHSIEKQAKYKLLDLLPKEIKNEYESIIIEQENENENWKLVFAADKLCAWLKCIEERRGGNKEFINAEKTIKKTLDNIKLKEVNYFINTFAKGFELSLDELSKDITSK